MSKKARPRQRAAKSRRKHQAQGVSLLIVLGVAVIVFAVIIAVVYSLEARQPAEDIPFPDVPRISLTETRTKLEAGQILLVDVRSKDAYDSLHITGAISMPEEQVATRLDELPVDREIVLYCT